MNDRAATHDELWPNWLRCGLIAVATLLLVSCRGTGAKQAACPGDCPPRAARGAAMQPTGELPPEALAAMNGGYAPAPLPMPGISPNNYGAWAPTAGPWPREEFLRDGGDYETPAGVREDSSVSGLEPEDAIGHFDTLDGRTIVQPSNRVHIYAPRFGAVRRVDTLHGHELTTHPGGIDKSLRLVKHDDLQIATTAIQPIQPIGQIGNKAANIHRVRQQGGELEERQHLSAAQDGILPHEDFQIIQLGIADQGEKARLSQAVLAAITWSSDQAVQVVIEGQKASTVQMNRQAEQIYVLDVPNQPKLRVIKTASTDSARPGEFVDFTLRFDNVGDQTMGNVTILDNLAIRLEYVVDTQQTSVDADFAAEPNQVGSDVLRWDLHEPLKPGDGGIIRFRCKVR